MSFTGSVFQAQKHYAFALVYLAQFMVYSVWAGISTSFEDKAITDFSNSKNSFLDDFIFTKNLRLSEKNADKLIKERIDVLSSTVHQIKKCNIPQDLNKQAEMLVKLEKIEKEIDPKVLLEKLSKHVYEKAEDLKIEISTLREGIIAKLFSLEHLQKSLEKLKSLTSEELSAEDTCKIQQFEKEAETLRTEIKSLKTTENIDSIKNKIQNLCSEMDFFIPVKKVPIYDDFVRVLDTLYKKMFGYVSRFVEWVKQGK